LCAAFYGNYVRDAIPSDCHDNQLSELKMHLAFLETYFHGSSSGIDPLVSYTKSALLLGGDGSPKRLATDNFNVDKVHIFLVNTKKHSNTNDNIKLFNDFLKEDKYLQDLKSNYNPLVNKCISEFLDGQPADFLSAISTLSMKQLSLFEPMIPSEFLKYFKMTTETAKFSLKLCGSGSGGFLLGFTSDFEYVSKLFYNENIKVVSVDLKRN
jgi:mevalonate kinase